MEMHPHGQEIVCISTEYEIRKFKDAPVKSEASAAV
jgi:hypothetical protein